MEPLVAVKTIWKMPKAALFPTLTKIWPLAFPPEATVTWDWNPTPTSSSEFDALMLTVPANPLTLVTV
jgi:hypothetical protein